MRDFGRDVVADGENICFSPFVLAGLLPGWHSVESTAR